MGYLYTLQRCIPVIDVIKSGMANSWAGKIGRTYRQREEVRGMNPGMGEMSEDGCTEMEKF